MPTNPETPVNFATPEQQGAFRLKPWLLQVLPKEQEHLLSVAFPKGTIIAITEVELP